MTKTQILEGELKEVGELNSVVLKEKQELMALGVIPDDSDSATKAFANLKAKLDKEKATQIVVRSKSTC
jgi:hypothetical protein